MSSLIKIFEFVTHGGTGDRVVRAMIGFGKFRDNTFKKKQFI